MATSWTTFTLKGNSSVSARGTVGTTVAELVTCGEPQATVYINNQDATAANTITVILNGTPVSGSDGIIIPGATEGASFREIKMVGGDVLRAIAGGDRAVDIIVVPTA